MYMNTAYLKNTLVSPRTPLDQEDLSVPVRILCCGVYRIYSLPRLDTERPAGRKDYQLLYFHSGRGHFYFSGADGPETVVHAGQMILFSPGSPQIYCYYSEDKTEVYWVHFTGNAVAGMLSHYGVPERTSVFKSGVHTAYKDLFLEMITELQLYRAGFEEMLVLKLKNLLLLTQRYQTEPAYTSTNTQKIIDDAVQYFNENYNRPIVIQDYAALHFVSAGWFIRNFRQYTGQTPTQYITSIRISNAYSLLEDPHRAIQEIAAMVGYDNPLYFSRIFRKQTGYSPSDYREILLSREKGGDSGSDRQ